METTKNIDEADIYRWLAEVPDPEIPVINILELGVVRDVRFSGHSGTAQIKITPTYNGCPAMDIISMQIRMALLSRGIKNVQIDYQLSPAWTSDWIPEAAKQKMLRYGIAPPKRRSTGSIDLFDEEPVSCPHCGAGETELISQFSSTSCKAMYRCNACREPFEHFKCH
ncbi:MAG TPA: 1,2-phenylacetyl-CoA epoxidase subunit PaaD [Edaphocola sp.]|nr:1,2-phenylacetyl-CoA epoxidase subunit PaaD [Edaphocola sp.]